MDQMVRRLKESGEYRKGMVLLIPRKRGVDAFDDAALAFFLRKSNRPAESLAVCRESVRAGSDCNWLRLEYTLAIDQTLDWQSAGLQHLRRAVSAMLQLSPESVVTVRGCYRLARRLAEQQLFQEALDWLGRLPRAALTGDWGRWVRLLQLKALAGLGNWDEILASTADAEGELPGDPFILRLRAKAWMKTGNLKKALALYVNRIVPLKAEWYVFGETADLYVLLGEVSEAFLYYSMAVLQPGKLDVKVNVLEKFATLCSAEDRNREAEVLSGMAEQIRRRNGWHREGHGGDLGRDGIFPETMNGMVRKLVMERIHWEKGKVTRVFGNGRTGFLRTVTGDSLFFTMFPERGAAPTSGYTVRYVTMPGFDQKRMKFGVRAMLAPTIQGGEDA